MRNAMFQGFGNFWNKQKRDSPDGFNESCVTESMIALVSNILGKNDENEFSWNSFVVLQLSKAYIPLAVNIYFERAGIFFLF